MKREQVVKLIETAIRKDEWNPGKQGQWARWHKINPTVLSDVLAGRRDPTDRLCEMVGVERVNVPASIVYRKAKP